VSDYYSTLIGSGLRAQGSWLKAQGSFEVA